MICAIVVREYVAIAPGGIVSQERSRIRGYRTKARVAGMCSKYLCIPENAIGRTVANDKQVGGARRPDTDVALIIYPDPFRKSASVCSTESEVSLFKTIVYLRGTSRHSCVLGFGTKTIIREELRLTNVAGRTLITVKFQDLCGCRIRLLYIYLSGDIQFRLRPRRPNADVAGACYPDRLIESTVVRIESQVSQSTTWNRTLNSSIFLKCSRVLASKPY